MCPCRIRDGRVRTHFSIGYAAPDAVANVLLAIWGSLIVNIMYRMSGVGTSFSFFSVPFWNWVPA